MKLGDKVMRLPETFTDSGEDKRSLRRPVAGRCGRCAAMLQEGYDLKRVGGGVDHKVTCSHCGRRRYGATYTIEKHSKSKA